MGKEQRHATIFCFFSLKQNICASVKSQKIEAYLICEHQKEKKKRQKMIIKITKKKKKNKEEK